MAVNEAVRAAADRKKASKEPIEDAWDRIFSMKNSAPDIERLERVHKAMMSGTLKRHTENNGKRFSKAEALRLFSDLVEIEKADKLHEMVKNTPENYRLIQNVRDFTEVIEMIERDEEIIAVDTETTGVDVYTDKIVGASITLPVNGIHVYIPIRHDKGPQIKETVVIEGLRTILEDESIKKIYHNANFDIQMFMSYGINHAGFYWDSMTAMHLLNENEPSYALKNLATKYLNEPSDTYSELFGNVGFNTIDLDVGLVYAAKDTDITWRLYEFQRKHLEKMPTVLQYYHDVEAPLLGAVIAMERTGFRIDTEFAEKYGQEISDEIDELRTKLADELGDINLNSPPQLKEALEKATGKTLESTDAKKVLKPLSKDFEVIDVLLRYKELTKLHSTYINVLPNLIHPKTGRLHGRFNASGTKTGRFSSGGSGVNLQNQPGRARKLFTAPEGTVIIGADFS